MSETTINKYPSVRVELKQCAVQVSGGDSIRKSKNKSTAKKITWENIQPVYLAWSVCVYVCVFSNVTLSGL